MVKIRKVDWVLLIVLIVLIVLTVLFIIDPALGEIFNLAGYTNQDTTYNITSGLIIVGIACFLGALIPFPVPYTVVVGVVAFQYYDGGLGFEAVFIMIAVATLSNITGDFIDWMIGRGGGYLAERESEKKEPTKWERIIKEKPALIPFLLILFGLTPLPDSLLFIPLGLMNYSGKKTMFYNFIGKLVMMIVISLLGIFAFEWIGILFGEGGGWLTGMIVLYLSWLIMFAMTRD